MTILPYKGLRFLHSNWYSSRYSLEEIKTLRHEDTAQEMIVTALRGSRVYYRPVYRYSDREELGGATFCERDQFDHYCLCAFPIDERLFLARKETP